MILAGTLKITIITFESQKSQHIFLARLVRLIKMARRRRLGENERLEEGVEGEVEIPNPDDNMITHPVETPILSEPMVEQTSTSEQVPHVHNIGRGQGIGPSTIPSTQPINLWGSLVYAMGQQLMNTMERWTTSFLDRMNTHLPTNTQGT